VAVSFLRFERCVVADVEPAAGRVAWVAGQAIKFPVHGFDMTACPEISAGAPALWLRKAKGLGPIAFDAVAICINHKLLPAQRLRQIPGRPPRFRALHW